MRRSWQPGDEEGGGRHVNFQKCDGTDVCAAVDEDGEQSGMPWGVGMPSPGLLAGPTPRSFGRHTRAPRAAASRWSLLGTEPRMASPHRTSSPSGAALHGTQREACSACGMSWISWGVCVWGGGCKREDAVCMSVTATANYVPGLPPSQCVL